ncbi:MAG: uracil phosphoribosyltransferase [Leeuwenhoekiella sp.]|uniref:Uracil phosphoribosyltransferase n=1 Tax=Leeuwenhoekiella nanhaiensis TaxID=1655491 RepID=A0A2G1VVI0_9FLAO|nr:uracil phosphoribosyltransferase [Leeuwenhoekiella nanhaiensis]PHQ30764.1 uracil phosphoribosyltransferase [Leeuwenhoekiella nanhaiensis]PHR96241.1 MAG: uracil phosphoribosyltransferase [Leeuwenhoekiella sp.]
MELKDLFYGIQDFFVDVAFAPLDWLRELQDSSWLAANLINIVFIIVVSVAFVYWCIQLNKFDSQEHHNLNS